jgi:hypothetical protein
VRIVSPHCASPISSIECLTTAAAQRAQVRHDSAAIEKSIEDGAASELRVTHDIAMVIDMVGNAVAATEGAEVSDGVLLCETGACGREQTEASYE